MYTPCPPTPITSPRPRAHHFATWTFPGIVIVPLHEKKMTVWRAHAQRAFSHGQPRTSFRVDGTWMRESLLMLACDMVVLHRRGRPSHYRCRRGVYVPEHGRAARAGGPATRVRCRRGKKTTTRGSGDRQPEPPWAEPMPVSTRQVSRAVGYHDGIDEGRQEARHVAGEYHSERV